jgi:hypothetical protein
MHRCRRFLAVGLTSLLGCALACSSDDAAPALDAGAETDAEVAAVSGADAAAETSVAHVPDCERATLQALIEAYFEALAAHDASHLPLAPDLKFTENAQRLEPGQGLWQKAGAAQFKRSALDPERCGTHTQAVLEEDGIAVLYGVRLQLTDGLISEIETFIARSGEYIVFGLTVFSTDLAASDAASSVKWEEPVPEAQRSTREQLNQIADLYFDSFGPAGIVAPIQNDCYRWENGYQTTFGDCTLFLPAPGTGQGGITQRRYPIADVENGIAIGYVLFRDSVDFHMFKVVDGQVRLIQALISAPGHSTTGWDPQDP